MTPMRAFGFGLAVFALLAASSCGSSSSSGGAGGAGATSDASVDGTSSGGTTSDASSGGAAQDAASGGAAGDGGGAAGQAGSGGSAEASAPSPAPVFDGKTGYVGIHDADVFSESTAGALTVEAWMRPDSTSMPAQTSGGYVHWMGKGGPGEQEWVARMYQDGNSAGRDNRISFYAFNLSGGLGAGSYFQDPVTSGQWIQYVGEIDGKNTLIFKNGAQRDKDPLSGYSITPKNGTSPVRIGTRQKETFFQGSIARVSFYKTALAPARVLAHYQARTAGDYDAVVLAEPSLVAFYRLDETTGTVAHDALGKHNGSYHGGVALGATSW